MAPSVPFFRISGISRKKFHFDAKILTVYGPAFAHYLFMKFPNTTQSVVLVEDDPDIREAICDILELEGYKVSAYENGKEALDRLHESPNPGLIILDLMMPVMNGFQFLKARSNDEALSDIPCFVVSAVGKRKEVMSEGAQGFLRKPVDADDILELVKAHIHMDEESPKPPKLLH